MRKIEMCTVHTADGQFHTGEIVRQPGKHTGTAIGAVIGTAFLGPVGGAIGAFIGSESTDKRVTIRSGGHSYRGEVVAGSRRVVELE